MSRSVIIETPEMTLEKYAEKVGVTKETLDGWVKRGYLPTVKQGKRRLVNVALRTCECLESEINYGQ